MKAVKFLVPFTLCALYNEGEIAGFDEAIADDLIERGIAKPVKAAPEKDKAPASEKPA